MIEYLMGQYPLDITNLDESKWWKSVVNSCENWFLYSSSEEGIQLALSKSINRARIFSGGSEELGYFMIGPRIYNNNIFNAIRHRGYLMKLCNYLYNFIS